MAFKASSLLCLALLFLSLSANAQEGQGINHIVSNRPGNFASGTNINTLLGANAFYDAGFTGQGTVSASVEAGHIWNSHQTLTQVTQFANHSSAFGSTANDLMDRHATWVGHHLGGRQNNGSTQSASWRNGIAHGTDLRSGAIASQWNGSAYALSFNFSGNSFDGGYSPYFGTADVINSSWGGTSPAGNNTFAIRLDGYANNNPSTTLVTSAGNSGPASNTIGYPGSGYNAITVAALANGGDNSYNSVANFSSRGPQDYFDPINGTVNGARAAIDIAGPGTNLHAAFYGGQTGGNHFTIPGSSPGSSSTDFYTFAVQGTSFASPIVAGAVSLIKSASYNTAALAANAATRDTRVVKSVLQNSADKIPGWNNGQVANGNGGVTTTQALDFASGAGALNIGQAFEQYVLAGTQDVPGMANGNLGLVDRVGWDMGNVLLGESNLYEISQALAGGSLFNVTLNWFRDRDYTGFLFNQTDNGQADLSLQVVNLTTNQVISESMSQFNTTEHLSFVLPSDGRYGVRVNYTQNTFGNQGSVDYGIAWSGFAAVPEPGALAVLTVVFAGCSLRRRRSK